MENKLKKQIGVKLKNARQSIGMTQSDVAKKMEISISAISDWEKGGRNPNLSQLDKLSSIYRRELSYFLEDKELNDTKVLWREKPDLPFALRVEAEFRRLVRQYKNLENWTVSRPTGDFRELFVGDFPKNFPAVEVLANEVREKSGMGERPGESLIRTFIEKYGVKLFFLPFKGSSASFYDQSLGASILLNSDNSGPRRNFDFAHEIFHLITWEKYQAQKSGEADKDCERFAQCFASNLLMPEESVKLAIVQGFDTDNKISLATLEYIARQFCVSNTALVWRTKNIFNLEMEKVKKLMNRFKSFYHNLPSRREPRNERTYPKRYIDLAIHALLYGDISSNKFLEYLEHYDGAKELLKRLLEDNSHHAEKHPKSIALIA